jgi:hypothetical protein
VEAVVGPPAPPESTRFNPYPSPPPDAQIYDTQHGYLTVTYSSPRGLAIHLELDLLEGKSPDDAFAIGSSFLPADAVDTGARVAGKRETIRVFKSASIARRLPPSHGMLFVECSGVDPARMCETLQIALGSP